MKRYSENRRRNNRLARAAVWREELLHKLWRVRSNGRDSGGIESRLGEIEAHLFNARRQPKGRR